jgi:tRNA pseudouridine65 synthase
MNLRILYQDENLVAIDKPAGFHVHPPEDARHRISRGSNCLHLLRKQLEQFLYPVHRLDRATSGVLLFAFQSEVARELNVALAAGQCRKTYFAVVRGWTKEDDTIEHPLEDRVTITSYERVATLELPESVGRYPTARYSLVKVSPRTGRTHQIRRHFAHLSHPLIGDTVYGDGRHNQFFREKLDFRGLFLKAYSLEFTHPVTSRPMKINARWNDLWHRAFDVIGTCPYVR